ncbi:hypothetical protein M3D48_10090, partial [Dermabacter vaginalis]|uniref:hypothetical protein n=1 Tax=Dermabacter vaginalis TaxID=1630135 RepID=UPI0021A7F30C
MSRHRLKVMLADQRELKLRYLPTRSAPLPGLPIGCSVTPSSSPFSDRATRVRSEEVIRPDDNLMALTRAVEVIG